MVQTSHSDSLLETSLSAAVRAVAGKHKLEVELLANATPDPLRMGATVHLTRPQDARGLASLRGQADMAALARRYHDPALHFRDKPTEETAAGIYDALEVMRLALLGAEHMEGIHQNMNALFTQHCEEAVYSSTTPPLADILAFMLRREATGEAAPDSLAPHIAEHEAWLRKQCGAQLHALTEHLHNQQDFSRFARQLLEHLAGMESGKESVQYTPSDSTGEGAEEMESTTDGEPETTEQLSAAPEPGAVRDASAWGEMPAAPGEGEMMLQEGEDIPAPSPTTDQPGYMEGAPAGDYKVFTSAHDEIIPAHKLATAEELTRLRGQLDDKLAAVRGTFAKLSSQLQRVLLARKQRTWEFDLEEGVLHSGHLARVVVSPSHNRIFKQEKHSEFRDTVVTLLLDNSGSMRGRPITLAAISADILAKTLERAGVKVEILGFTTKDWKGGDSFRDWVKADKPLRPGRLNDIRHIIYKSADQPLTRARRNLGLMLKDGILKENIDGEALLWAHHRLLNRPEDRRILMVISDGAPVDDSSLSANGANYLDHHLREVIAMIEKKGKVELVAIGIGHDVTRYYQRSVTINDVSRLGETMTKELVELFRN